LKLLKIISCALLLISMTASAAEAPKEAAIHAAMEKASTAMFTEFANQGGFVWLYTEDGIPYGERKARPSMIWVEPPGTPSVGIMLLEAHKTTGDAQYMDYAERVADALIKGQHPAGGWNYFIDFDPDGYKDYWESFFSKCWGWQEYLKYRTNCTFDDFATTEPIRFLLRLCTVNPKPRFVAARDKALSFVLEAQFDNGAWPQRYPLDKDYSAYYTFNDGVIADCIDMLLEAHDTLREARYEEAARKGMDFYLLAQLPEPQPGWAQQHKPDLSPGWGRPFEIGTVCAGQTVDNMQDLMRFYQITGDKKYLSPIPSALDWLERIQFKDVEGYTHTYYYEVDTDRPLYIKQTGTTVEDVEFKQTYDVEGCYPYGHRISLPIAQLRKDHQRFTDSSPEVVQAAYRNEQQEKGIPREKKGYYFYRVLATTEDTAEGVTKIIQSQDERGLWPEAISWMDPYSPFTAPKKEFQGYTTGGYMANMYRMISYLNEQHP
jgi:hypothetical protein